MGATIAQVAEGLRHFRPSADLSPGRMNLFTLGRRTIIVDFAHNEAGTRAILDVAAGIAGGAAGRTAPVTAIIGTAGDRPDDTLRGIGRIAAERAQRVVLKETPMYLRGRDRENVIATILEGVAAGGVDPATVPVYEGEAAALEAELVGSNGAAAAEGRAEAPRVDRPVLPCRARRGVRAARPARRTPARRRGQPRGPRPAPRRPPAQLAVDRSGGPASLPQRRLELPRIREGGRSVARPASVIASPVHAHGIVRADHDEVAGRRAPERGATAAASSRIFSTFTVRPVPSVRAALTPLATFAGCLAGLATAEVLVLADDDLVERSPGEGAVVVLVLVPPIAGDADHADRAARPRRVRDGRTREPRARLPVSAVRPSSG